MSEPEVEWVGTSCGKHGSYTFYKGFKLTVNGETKKYLLGEFYFVRNSKDRPICIAELQLVWHDANTGNQLASARLYFRPEAIPGGRQNTHGKDELLYTDEKVVIKCRDMINLECDAREWCYGMKALSELNLQEVYIPNNNAKEAPKKYRLRKNFLKQNKTEISLKERAKIVILSFPAYCRYQSLMKKLLNGLVLSKMAIIAFGGVIKNNDSTWVLFSRDSFHHPELDKFDIFNDNKAPVLKGRPRKKRSTKASCRGQPRGKYRRRMDSIPRSDIVDRRPSPEWYSSDDNQTDTSEASSVGVQELPCPPKLVSAVKDEKVMARDMTQGVIRSHGDVKPTIIPPIPKLVKIEPKDHNGSTYGQFRPSDVKVEPLPQSNPVSICRMENNVVPKMTPSSKKASVISSTYNTLHKPLYHPINVRPQPSSGMARETQSHDTQAHGIPVVAPQSKTTNVPVNPLQPPRVAHAKTMIMNRTIQPRMSAIVCTTKDDEAARSLSTPLPSKPGEEQRLECGNDWKQTLKRKRGRPPGKSTKFMKVQEGKVTANQGKPVEQADVIQVPIKTEPITTSQDEIKIIENQGSPESEDAAEREFMATLKKFMKKRGSPIEKIPALGFRKINLFKMYEVTGALGGYDVVTGNRLWRRVYNEVGGAPSITSAATNSRKHYERLLLPYERYMKGQDSSLKVEPLDTPAVSQENEKVVKTQKDQNANVVPKIKNEPVPIAQSLQNKPLKPAVSALTSQSQQNKPLKPAVSVLTQQSQQKKPLKPAVSLSTQQSQQNKPLKPTVSVLAQQSQSVLAQQSQQNKLFKPAVSVSEARIAYTASDMNSSSVDFVTTGSRGSPIMLYSSNVDQLPRRYVSSEEVPRSSPSVRYESRPRVITSVADRELRLRNELRSSTPDVVWNETRSYIAETIEDDPRIYTSQKSRKNELRTSVIDFERNELRTSAPDFERIHEYMPRHVAVDHVNDFRPRAQESRRSNDHHLHVRTKNTTPVEVTHEPRDSHKKKVARDPGDGVLMMDMRLADGKMQSSHSHSPRQRDDAYISAYSLPVLTHRAHGVELYDLPNFPIRTASRIHMPSSHQVFPGSSHAAAALSPYPTHIIATEHGAVYPIPMPGFFPPDGFYMVNS